MPEAQRYQAPIREVTVFRRGARIVRSFDLLRSGAGFAGLVRVDGLPLSLDDGSIRVSVHGDGALPVASAVRIGLAPLAHADVDDVPSDAALRDARERERVLELELETTTRARDRLLALEPTARPEPEEGKPPIEARLDGRMALLAFRGKELERLDARIAEQIAEHAGASRLRRDLEEKISRLSTARSARAGEMRKVAWIELVDAGASAERARIDLAYVVPGARWSPAYAIYFDASLSRCRLAARAVVAQRTGEDWTGVRVSLSTAEPQSYVELPELAALRIGRRQGPPRARGFRSAPEVDETLFADFDAARRRLGRPASAEPTEEGALTAVMHADELLVDADEATPVAERRAQREASSLLPGGAPPPPAMASPMAPPPRAAAAPAPLSVSQDARAAVAGGLVARRAEAPVLPQSAALSLRKGGARSHTATFAAVAPPRAPSGAAAASETARELDDADVEHLLDFGALRVPDYRVANRGKLIQKSSLLQYVEHGSFDFQAALKALREAAADAERIEPLPPVYRDVAPLHGYHHVFTAGAPVDIPSDAKFHTIGLVEADAGCKLTYVVVPRESSEAYRVVTIENPIDAPLLEGPCDVYRGRDFFSTTQLRPTARGASVPLGLGVEQAIKVARNARYFEETSGLLRGSLDLNHEVRIEIANLTPSSARFEVRERLPHARENDDEVEVQVQETTPPWEEYRQDEAPLVRGHAWRFELPSGERKTLTLRYVVRIPAKYELTGGNRREA